MSKPIDASANTLDLTGSAMMLKQLKRKACFRRLSDRKATGLRSRNIV